MYYDLGLQGDESEAFLQRDRLATAVRLGYDCVAIAHQAADRLSDKDRYNTAESPYVLRAWMHCAGLVAWESCHWASFCRCSQMPFDAATLAAAAPGVSEALRAQQALIRPHGGSQGQAIQLSRLTLAMQEAAPAAQLLGAANPITSSFDILAVQPLSDRVFQQVTPCCQQARFFRAQNSNHGLQNLHTWHWQLRAHAASCQTLSVIKKRGAMKASKSNEGFGHVAHAYRHA